MFILSNNYSLFQHSVGIGRMRYEQRPLQEKSIERVSSPEQLNDYVKVSSPGIWAVLAAVLCLTAAFAVSPTLRSKALHWAAKVFPTHTELRLNPDAAPANGQTYEPVVNWLPVGLTLEEQRSDCGFSNYHYTDSDGCWLDVELLLFSSGGVMSLDTENADVRETVISGYPAITIHKEGVSVAACTLEDLNAILLVTGQGFSVDDVVRVAESVRLR
mgnify:CR=1 FL=1